jgi:hypothetical protein
MLVIVFALPASAQAQYRSTSDRARMELAFDHGFGGGSEGGYAELAIDMRVWAPFGLGLVLRTGLASNGFSNALAADLGPAVRIIGGGKLGGVALSLAGGLAYAYGPFHEGWAHGVGAFALLAIDFWYRNFFAGLAASGHVLFASERQTPIWTLAPMLRVGGDWGL